MMGFINNELKIFLLAVQFLTRIPVPGTKIWSEERFRNSVRYYPLVGVLIGAIAAAIFIGANLVFSPLLAVLLSTALTILLTGAFHEDGLADTFDGIGGGTTKSRALEIMKDSRLGTYGMLAGVIVLALKIVTLAEISVANIAVILIAAHGLSRLSSVIVIASSQYVRFEGKSKPVAVGLPVGSLVFALLSGVACCALLYNWLTPVALGAGLGGAIIGHLVARGVFERKIGGYTGDCLGATQQLTEVGLYLGVLACQLP